jgi:hypothetical protein
MIESGTIRFSGDGGSVLVIASARMDIVPVFLAEDDWVGSFSSGKRAGQKNPIDPACRGEAERRLVDPV